MRRFMASMLAALGALSTPLIAQRDTVAAPSQPARSAIGFGFAATLGSGWQIEGGEFAYVRRFRGGAVEAISLGARVGAFIDEGAIIGGTRGFVFGPTIGARTGTWSIAEIGDEQNVTSIGIDLTAELSGYISTSSPMGHGSQWLGAALLPGIKAGSVTGLRYGVVVGPTLFVGNGKSKVRGLIAFRGEAPLARRERYP